VGTPWDPRQRRPSPGDENPGGVRRSERLRAEKGTPQAWGAAPSEASQSPPVRRPVRRRRRPARWWPPRRYSCPFVVRQLEGFGLRPGSGRASQRDETGQRMRASLTAALDRYYWPAGSTRTANGQTPFGSISQESRPDVFGSVLPKAPVNRASQAPRSSRRRIPDHRHRRSPLKFSRIRRCRCRQ